MKQRTIKTVAAALAAVVLGGLCMIPCFAAGTAPEAGPYDLFVSPDGDDAAAGTQAAPLKTPAAAKERLKALRDVPDAQTGVHVWLRGGRYAFTDTLRFTVDDLPGVAYAAWDGEDVVFSGAREITGFTEGEANGVRVFIKRLEPAACDFGSLFNGETQLSVPRYPEEGYFTVKATAPEDDLWTEDDTPWELTLGQRSFYADPADIGVEMTNPQDVCVRILHYWHDELMKVAGYDAGTGKLSLSRPSSMKIRDIDRYYFENVFEALDAPGEWYLDRTAGALYYVPREGERAETLTLYASSLERLVDIDGVSGLSFRGIRFTQTDWTVPHPGADFGDWRAENDIDALQAAMDVNGVITVNHAAQTVFENCAFTDLGADAVKFVNGVKDSRVENCYFENIAATAVFVGGRNCLPDEPDYTENIRVANNEIYRYGRKFFCAIGVHITYCDTAEVCHNEIHDGYYTGISCGWVWGYSYHATRNIRISDNLIYDIGQGWLSDMGGIYMLGVQPGTVLSGNVIHNVAADPGEGGYGGWGIYLDEGSSRMTVEKNLVFCCGSQGFNIHYGEGNVIRNNISALSAEGQVSVGTRSGEDHATAFYYDNIFVTDRGLPAYIHMHDPSHFYDNGNLFWDLSGAKNLTCAKDNFDSPIPLDAAKRQGFVHNATVADPLFRDLSAFDFTLAEDSPALALHFQPWDYAAAGTLPGTTVGVSRPGGQTAYNAGARLNEYGKTRGTALSSVSAAAIAAFAAALAAGLAALLARAPKRAAALFCAVALSCVAAFAAYSFFTDWAPVPYALAEIALSAAAAVPLFLLRRKDAAGKRAVLRYLLTAFAPVFCAFTALTLLLNNVLRIGEPNAMGVVLTLLGLFLLVTTALCGAKQRKEKE